MLRSLALLAAAISLPAMAQVSAPQPVAIVDTIPPARDVAYPGTMRLDVDASDTMQGIWRVTQTIPVAGAGPMVLLHPKWLPGNHAPRGQIEKLAGLVITGGGRVLPWRRDAVDMHAFHIDVPAGVSAIEARFQFLTATDGDQGRIVVTQEMLNLQFEAVSLYPAGYFTRRIPVVASVRYPAGWRQASALNATATGDRVTYEPTNYEVLIDSPVFAGKHFREDDLGQNVRIATVADTAKELAVAPAILDKHRALVTQSIKLFGTRPFDRYVFLHAITDRMGGIGLEHHRSSENQNEPGYFTDWEGSLLDHNLIPHEFVHSWNGKFRRGADLWTPDYRTPMRDSLLWVYEGQTQFWGHVLEARSGLSSKAQVLDKLAVIAAGLDNLPGRAWRPLVDTTNDPIVSARRPKGWASQQRNEDYYNEGMLIWIEADAIIRDGTRNRRSMDDFARAFFGLREGDYGQVTYTRDDVVRTLNGVYPYDWDGFLRARVEDVNAKAPLGGFERSGYALRYTDTPSAVVKAQMKARRVADHWYSLGLTVGRGAKVAGVRWDSPAFKAGLTTGRTIVAVNGLSYSDDALKDAIVAAKGAREPIRLTVKRGVHLRDVAIAWDGGLRYPVLVKTGTGDGALDRLLAPRP